MEAFIPLNIDPFIAVGSVTTLGQFQTSKQAKGLPADFPMLNCSNMRECVFCVPEVSRKPSGLEKLRAHAGKPLTDYVWETMMTLSTSGLLQCQATTDLSDVQLECVLVNLLVMKRLEPFVKGRLHDTKPKIAMPSSGLQHAI